MPELCRYLILYGGVVYLYENGASVYTLGSPANFIQRKFGLRVYRDELGVRRIAIFLDGAFVYGSSAVVPDGNLYVDALIYHNNIKLGTIKIVNY